jgi:hypothetical protein
MPNQTPEKHTDAASAIAPTIREVEVAESASATDTSDAQIDHVAG